MAKYLNSLHSDDIDTDQNGQMFLATKFHIVGFVAVLLKYSRQHENKYIITNEVQHEKTCLWGFRPGRTKLGL